MRLMANHMKKYVLFFSMVGFVVFTNGSVSAQLGSYKGESLLLQKKIQLALHDMERLVEEIRRIDEPWSKRLLLEEVETILYKEVEFPLSVQGGGISKQNVDNVAELLGIEQRLLSELFARAFALVGIAKAYEGFVAAGEDFLVIAQEIFPDTPSLTMKIDSFESAKTVREWMSDASRIEGGSLPVRISFKGKTLPSSEVVENLNHATVRFITEQPDQDMDYVLYVAAHDFIKGVLRKATLADILTDQDSRWFTIYLPPGKYQLVINLLEKFTSNIVAHPDPNSNEHLIEGLSQGITVYPSPSIKNNPQRSSRPGKKNNMGQKPTTSSIKE